MLLPLKKLLRSSIKRAGIVKEVEASMVLKEFDKLVESFWGKEVLAKIRPQYVRDKILTISCYNSIWAQEIKLNEKKIIEVINKKMGKVLINQIRYL